MCNAEAPSVEAARQKWDGQVDFVGVAWTGDDASFQAFIDKYSLTFPTISDDPGEIFSRFSVPGQPALVVVDKTGASQTFLGRVEEDQLNSALTAAVAA